MSFGTSNLIDVAENFPYDRSPNYSSRDGTTIQAVIVHFTAAGEARGSIAWLSNPIAKASAHDVISRSGEGYHLVKEEYAAWHAGSATSKPSLNGKTGVNKFSIGIELANWGPIYQAEENVTVLIDTGKLDTNGKKVFESRTRVKGELYVNLKDWTWPYKGPKPVESKLELTGQVSDWPSKTPVITLWEPYPSSQILTLIMRCRWWVYKYPQITAKTIVGHEDVDPTRKVDPGPAFPWEQVRSGIFDRPIVASTAVVVANRGCLDTVGANEMLKSMSGDTGLSHE